MKKVFCLVAIYSILCLTAVFSLPQGSTANEKVDQTSDCMECHTVDFGSTDPIEQHVQHPTGTVASNGLVISCASCHDGGVGEPGNVYNHSCTLCHFEKCESVTIHESDHAADCISCHTECEENGNGDTPPDSGSTCPAVVIYGEGSEEVELLRAYRDDVLSKTFKGQKLISLYYSLSPAMVLAVESSETVKGIVKDRIDAALPMIKVQLALE